MLTIKYRYITQQNYMATSRLTLVVATITAGLMAIQ